MTLKEKNILLDLAQKALLRGDIDRAIYEYQCAIKLDPEDSKLHQTLGDLFIKKNKIQEAIAELTIVAEAQKQKGFYLKSVAIYKKISRLIPDMPEPYENMAELYSELKLPSEAKENYIWLIDYFDKKKDNRKKIGYFSRLSDLYPNDVGLRVKLAQMLINEQMGNEASVEYLKIGIEYFRRKELKEAMSYFEKAIGLKPDCFAGYKWLAKSHFNEGNTEKAISLFEKSLSFKPDDLDNLIYLAQAFSKTDLDDKAIDIFVKILKTEPSLTVIREKLAKLYLKKGEKESAKTEFKKVVDNHLAKKEFKKALELLEAIIRENIFDLELQEKFAFALKSSGEKEKAIEEYEKLARGYEETGLFDKAIKAIENIIAINPDIPNIKKRMDILLDKLLVIEKSKIQKKKRDKKNDTGYVELDEDDFSDDGLERVELLLEKGLVDEAIEYLEQEKAKAEENTSTAYEKKTEEVKSSLRVRYGEEESGDFFDLRESLKEDIEGLSNKEESSGEGNFSLEEILDKFKKAIETEIDAEDYRTHYDLGIALMEMELFDDAIKEFHIVLKDPALQKAGEKKFLDCCNLLGNCYFKTGMFSEAGAEIEKGLNSAGYQQRDYITLKLLKGLVLENINDPHGAAGVYTDILSTDPGNEEAKNRLRELQKANP